jgi:hypothetical protein
MILEPGKEFKLYIKYATDLVLGRENQVRISGKHVPNMQESAQSGWAAQPV